MRKITILLCLIVSLLYVENIASDEFNLLKLIPEQKLEKCGLSKLNQEELGNLSREVSILVKNAYELGLKEATQSERVGIAVIAPSVSTSIKARELRMQMGLMEVEPKQADNVLVVVRSELFDPLNYSYDFYSELKEDADYQLNISGSIYHVYIYQINNDLSVSQMSHNSFSAGED